MTIPQELADGIAALLGLIVGWFSKWLHGKASSS